VDGAGSGSCYVKIFHIRYVESSCSAARLVFRYQNGLFLFQRWKAEASLGRDGGVLPKLVARRMGGLHYGSGITANCPPAVVAECARN
jgi:hypothetical protein